MNNYDDQSRGTPVAISGARVLTSAQLLELLGDQIVPGGGGTGGQSISVGGDEAVGPFEIVTYPECVDGHIVIHTGHKDFGTGMSVDDGSVATTIPCAVAANEAGDGEPHQTAELVGGGFLATVPPDLVDRVDIDRSVFVLVSLALSVEDPPLQPISTTWITAACENEHVVMHYGHEDPNTMTSVYDGSVATSVPC
jgi:hypothetical protein